VDHEAVRWGGKFKSVRRTQNVNTLRQYELMTIFPLEEDQHKAGREQLLTDLGNNGAEIEKTDELGDRDLAYEIKKRKRGKYVLFTIKADPAKIANMDRIFKLNANLVKYLFVNIEDSKTEGPRTEGREKHG